MVLARAGLARLGRLDAMTEAFGPDVMAPAPGQGALAVEVRSSDLVAGPRSTRRSGRSTTGPPTWPSSPSAPCSRGSRPGAPRPSAPPPTWPPRPAAEPRAVIARPDGTATLRRGGATTLGADSLDDARRLGVELAETLLAAGAADLAVLGAVR